jgi:hypothetical protein
MAGSPTQAMDRTCGAQHRWSLIIFAVRSKRKRGALISFVNPILTIEVADQTYIDALQRIITEIHGCSSEHWDTAHVREVIGETVIWEGDVEIFYVFGHPKARRCFAWVRERARLHQPVRFFAILDSTFIHSAEDAVKYARISESANLIEEISRVIPPG